MTFVPPPSLGPFLFPPPYSTRGIRLTNPSNAPNGCQPRLYPYHCVINQHAGQEHVLVFLGRIGTSPIILAVHKATGTVQIVRELPWTSTGENCYFSDTDPDALYCLDGPRVCVYRVSTGWVETVCTLDLRYGDDLWQAHSASDDQVHSATVRRRTDDGPYEVLGCVVFRDGQQAFLPRRREYDECQIDKSGRWLVIQEDGHNRIVDLEKNAERLILNGDGACAHLDVGDAYMVGEDDSGAHWQMVRWDLAGGPKHVLVTGGEAWGAGMGHCAARPQFALLSSNESGDLIRVPYDGSPRTLIAPGMIDGSDYDHQLRACLDPTGEYACWIFFDAGRFDACLVQLPGGTTPPIVIHPPTPDPGGSMHHLPIFPEPGDASVVLHHDNGYEANSTPGEADGRPAQVLALADNLPEGHGATLTVTWADGTALEQHGRLFLKRGDRPEFLADVFRKPRSFR